MDPLSWLNKCEHFFGYHNTSEEQAMNIASFHLEGEAQHWFFELMKDKPSLAWDTFKEQCNRRFGPPIRDDVLGELAKLRHTFYGGVYFSI